MQFFEKLLFPPKCPLCDRCLKPDEKGFCNICKDKKIFIQGRICEKCGRSTEDKSGLCKDCKSDEHIFNGGRVIFSYKEMAGSIYRFKYMNRPAYANEYAPLIKEYLQSWIEALEPDGIIPVPLHKKRLIARGYNQAEELARAISECFNIPMYANCAERIKNTVPQKQMDKKGRRRNLKKAFIIRENVVKLETVVLIDDIYTTGSTIDSLAKELKASGVKYVYFIALSAAGT